MTYQKYSASTNDETFYEKVKIVVVTKKQEKIKKKVLEWQRKRPPKIIRGFAKKMKRGTWHERFTAGVLKELGEVYERQVPIQCKDKWYIMDFYFPMRNLCLEIDGSQHKKQRVYDKKRDAAIWVHGIRTHRIENALMHNVMQAYYLIGQAFKNG